MWQMERCVSFTGVSNVLEFGRVQNDAVYVAPISVFFLFYEYLLIFK